MSSVMRFDEWQDSNGVPVLDGTGGNLALGKILQVVSTTKTDVFSVSVADNAQAEVTGFTATITPSSTSSKIFVICSLGLGANSPTASLFRGATQIALGDLASPRKRVFSGAATEANAPASVGISFLDSPNTTSATTYSIQIGHGNNITETIHLNRGQGDASLDNISRGASTITLMEVAG